MSFFGIHNHTDVGSNLRLRDSTNKVEQLIQYSHDLGHKGLVITDHESITAHVQALEYYDKNKNKEDWKDFKLGLGNEIYLCPDMPDENQRPVVFPHFILIALDATGHKGLRELSTTSWVKNAFMSVMYRVPTYYSDFTDVISRYKGHLIGSSACIGGNLPRRLLKYRDHPTNDIWESCLSWVQLMNTLFGDGYFFLELQPSESEDQIYVNQKLVDISTIVHVPYLISTDAHYLKKENRSVHKAFLNAQDGDREVDEFYATTYVMSESEIHSYMDQYLGYDVVQRGIDNTLLVYDKINNYKLTKDLEIPYIPLDLTEPSRDLYIKYQEKISLLGVLYNSEHDSDRHMVRVLLEAIENHPNYQTQLGYDKINECLDYLIKSSDTNHVRWSKYLMQERDYVKVAWDTGSLVGPGRGSGVGFCLLYLLDITQVDPLREETQTFPWRLNSIVS